MLYNSITQLKPYAKLYRIRGEHLAGVNRVIYSCVCAFLPVLIKYGAEMLFAAHSHSVHFYRVRARYQYQAFS